MGKIRVYGSVLAVFLTALTAQPGQAQDAWGGTPEIVTEGYQFTEGPYWHPQGYLLFSDIPANTIYKWHPDSAAAVPYIRPSGHSNGLAATPDGQLIVCQHDGSVAMAQGDSSLTILAAAYQGRRLNSPNDAIVRSDGTVYFTDPPYGVADSLRELSFSGVYRITDGGRAELLYDQLETPNGIALSPDEQTLYVNNTVDGRILAFDITSDGSVSLPSHFAGVGAADSTGAADGMVVDGSGRLYSTGPGGIHIFSPAGEKLGFISIPASATNLSWGRKDHPELFVTTPSAVYRVPVTPPSRSVKKN